MMRYLILALVVVLVVWWLLGRPRKRAAADRAAARRQAPVSFAVCAHCGVHVPTDEAVLDGQRAYCSESHRLAGPREHG
jgi:uncharacterized protein